MGIPAGHPSRTKGVGARADGVNGIRRVPLPFILVGRGTRRFNGVELSTKQEVRDAFGAWLGLFPWTYFLTITFRSPRQPHHALSTIRECGRVVRRHSKGRLFLGTELHISRTLHVHGLLNAPYGANDFLEYALWQSLYTSFGRSEVRTVRSREAVSVYVSKYVTKELTEWDMPP